MPVKDTPPAYQLEAWMRGPDGALEPFALSIDPPGRLKQHDWVCQFECKALGFSQRRWIGGADAEQAFALTLAFVAQLLNYDKKQIVDGDGRMIRLPIDHVASAIGCWAHLCDGDRETKREPEPDRPLPVAVPYNVKARAEATNGKLSAFDLRVTEPQSTSTGEFECSVHCALLGFAGQSHRGIDAAQAFALTLWLVADQLNSRSLVLIDDAGKPFDLPIDWSAGIPRRFT